MSHGEDNFVEALGQERCSINGAGQQEICVSKKWICINCRKSCSWKREMRADVESGEDGWGWGGQRWAPIDTDPRRPNPRAPTAPTTGGHPGHPGHPRHPPPRSGSTLLLPEFLFLGFWGFTFFFLGLSILILADLPLGHAWKKDMFWNFLKTNS